MATNPEERYVSARALAADGTKWLGDDPVCYRLSAASTWQLAFPICHTAPKNSRNHA